MWELIKERGRAVVAVAAVCMAVYGVYMFAGGGAVTRVSAQQDTYLARRIDQVEQRIYQIESRINQIELKNIGNETRTPQLFDNNQNELTFLRTQIEGMRLRLGEVECGLLRVDERTLAPSHKAPAGKDVCRQNASEPVRLSTRN